MDRLRIWWDGLKAFLLREERERQLDAELFPARRAAMVEPADILREE